MSNYTYTIKFPGTTATAVVTDQHEIRVTKQGYIYRLDNAVIAVIKRGTGALDKFGREWVDYSDTIGCTDVVKQSEWCQLMARYKGKFYPVEAVVCGFAPQPCIYI